MYLDYAIIIVYLITVAGLGFFHGRKEKTTEDFFLAGRSMAWWTVCVSILATEISAVTFIGTPEEGFRRNYFYLQFAFGSLLGRYLIAYVLLPAFYKRRIDTIYGYIRHRFGPASHILASLFFLITRIMASGVRLYVASLAFSVVMGWSLFSAMVLMVCVAAFYTCLGGLKAVMWTDLAQIILFFGGALAALFYLFHAIPGGFSGILGEVHKVFQEDGVNKLKVFHFAFNLSDPHTFLVSVLFGCFMTFAALGADQDLAQRLLSCDHVKKSQRAIILTGWIDFPVVILFLFVGTSLFAYFRVYPDAALPDSTAKIFPHFIVHGLPPGLRGLLLAGILAAAMSSLDSAMNALASVIVLDLYKPYFRYLAVPATRAILWRNPLKFLHITSLKSQDVKEPGDRELLFMARGCVLFFSLVLLAFAWACEGRDQVLYLAFKLVSFTYGALLGIFCLGALTKRGSDRGNLWAMFGSTALVTVIHLGQSGLIRKGVLENLLIGWSWYIIIGTLSTFAIGACFGGKPDNRDARTQDLSWAQE